jgi:hypothetical protein
VARSLQEVAGFFGVSRDTTKAWSIAGMPKEPIGAGKRFRFRLNAVLAWLRRDGPWRPRFSDPEDPLVEAGGDSPGLERLRLAKAAIAELDLAARRRELLDRDKARQALLRFATIIRRAGERLGVRYGADALALLNEALDECGTVIDAEFGSPSPDTSA